MTIQEISNLLEGTTETLRANLLQNISKSDVPAAYMQEQSGAGKPEQAIVVNPISAAMEASRKGQNRKMLEEVTL